MGGGLLNLFDRFNGNDTNKNNCLQYDVVYNF